MRRCAVVATAIFAIIPLGGRAAAGNSISLTLPIACTLGKNCFIQQYPDHDPGPGAQDYHCGIATYDGHDGTDFRILSTKAAAEGVQVLASAAGRVKAFRDGVEDRLVASDEDRARVKDRECGNGVVIDHGDGWETQYCHMRRGSVVVRKGQSVAAGTPLGQVGYSGMAQFAHVHLTVRHNGEAIDPFLGAAVSDHCVADAGEPAASLWAPDLRESLKYQDGIIVETGFSSAPVSPSAVEQGAVPAASADGAALLFYVHLANLRQGDRLHLELDGPGGFHAANETQPLDRAKARYVAFAGKKRSGERWPAGSYKGSVEVIRAGAAIRAASGELQLQ